MLHADRRFTDAVAKKVAELEKATDAEIIVVAAERSGSYRDVAMVAAAGLAGLTFAVLVFMPWPVHPLLAILDLGFAFGIASWALDGRGPVTRLAPKERRHAQVQRAAAAEFHLEAVHATPRRTGVLVYVSAQEAEIELVPDLGIEARIPKADWAEVVRTLDATDLDRFLQGLDALGRLLATHVPPAGERGVGMADAPRIRA